MYVLIHYSANTANTVGHKMVSFLFLRYFDIIDMWFN